MRKYLSVLPRLKNIAFTRDSYEQPMFRGEADHERYYTDRFPSVEEMLAVEIGYGSEEARNQVWEDGHRRRMVLEAEKYVSLMQNLEWIYLGQYPMAVIRRDSEEEERQFVLLCDERDSCDTFLSRMFG
jgi:hypothetical protein